MLKIYRMPVLHIPRRINLKRRCLRRKVIKSPIVEVQPEDDKDVTGGVVTSRTTFFAEESDKDSDYSDSSLEESDESSIDVSNREIKHALSAGGLDLHLETVMNKDDLAFVPFFFFFFLLSILLISIPIFLSSLTMSQHRQGYSSSGGPEGSADSD